jgi:hypothetical protein
MANNNNRNDGNEGDNRNRKTPREDEQQRQGRADVAREPLLDEQQQQDDATEIDQGSRQGEGMGPQRQSDQIGGGGRTDGNGSDRA